MMFSKAKLILGNSKKCFYLMRPCSASARDMEAIGCREVVGPGINNQPAYSDRPDFPFPSIRFLADNPYLQALREKERGDWRSLTIDEKKCLYRSSFCKTFEEMSAPTGEWKSVIGCSLFFISLALWMVMFIKKFVLPQELPPTLKLESQQAQLQRIIDASMNPIEGISSKWDYEKGDWKK